MCVAISGQHLKHSVVNRQQSDVKRSTTEVKHQDVLFSFLLVQAVSNSGSRPIDQIQQMFNIAERTFCWLKLCIQISPSSTRMPKRWRNISAILDTAKWHKESTKKAQRTMLTVNNWLKILLENFAQIKVSKKLNLYTTKSTLQIKLPSCAAASRSVLINRCLI